MSYGGESVAKKVPRLNWWKGILAAHPALLTARIMVLAGPGAGDARVLRGLGADMSRVTMIDMNPDALESARSIVPEARAFLGTDLDAAISMRGKVDVVALDYCRQLSRTSVGEFGRVSAIALRSVGGIAACGMSYGRETGDAGKAVERARLSARHTAAVDVYARLKSIGRDAYVTMTAGTKGSGVQLTDRDMNRAARYEVFQGAARAAFGRVSLRFEEVAFHFYQSATGAKVGTPMMYATGKARRGRGYTTAADAAERRARVQIERALCERWREFTEGGMTDNVRGAVMDAMVDEGGAIGLSNAESVRAAAISTAREFGSRVTADLLALDEIDARRVPAWVAVDTREQRRSA